MSSSQEIQLFDVVYKLWKKRKRLLLLAVIGGIGGLIIAFSIPKEYRTEVKLSPENSENNKMGQLGGLAAMAGINLSSGSGGSDALYPELYPDIVSSTRFLLELVNVPVKDNNGKYETTFYDYMQSYQHKPWWDHVVEGPFKIIGWGASLFKKKDAETEKEIDPFYLTKDQEDFIKAVRRKVAVGVDSKTGVVTAAVTLQDPLVCATVMSTVLTNLQEYITDYRTRKAKHDLAFTQKLFNEAQAAYYKNQQNYARYLDENKNVISASFRLEEERLRNEVSLTFGVYNQMAQQLEMNKIKVKEKTPVYTVIESARVPLKPVSPNKLFLMIVFAFFFVLGGACWIAVKDKAIEIKNKLNS